MSTGDKKIKNASKKQDCTDHQHTNSVVIVKEDSTSEPQKNLRKSLKELTTGVQPIDYEEELINKRNDIKRDASNSLLLFPQDNIMFYKQGRELRTEYSTVPPQAFKDANNLFVKECLNIYTCENCILDFKYKQYDGSYHQLEKNQLLNTFSGLIQPLFEIDVDVDETDGIHDTVLVPTKENGIYKEGYLTKSPFHSDGNPVLGSKQVESVISKTYKRRWFTLKQTSNDGSYILEYRKEEGSAFAKGTLYLDSCTQIQKGVKGRMYGFELHIQDKIYGLAADSLTEMEGWIKALCKSIGIEIEQEKSSRGFFSGRSAQPKPKNLRDSLKNSSHPLLQEFAKETEEGNRKNRQRNRVKILSVYPDVNNSFGIENPKESFIEPFRVALRHRFVVELVDLAFKLCNQSSQGKTQNCEPFFLSLALFDSRNGKKLSEDFTCDLNETSVKDMLLPDNPVSENGHESFSNQRDKDSTFSSPKMCVFSVESPHPDIYLVLRVNKVLQGGIGQCTEPYIKAFDHPKTAQKITKQARLMCKRLGKFTTPFGWAARTVFKSDGEVDLTAEFTPIYKQETAKLTDDEMIKLLQDMKGDTKFNKQIIPGNFHCLISKLALNHPNCYSPSLIPLKPFSRSEDIQPSLEIQTFSHGKTETSLPCTDYANNFYIFPVSLNYGPQKTVKARNISCTVQFKDSDELSAKPLKCIYQRNGTCSFTHQVTCPVVYHNTAPTFYEEIKILLPPQLEAKHHVLFTFHHVSVEQPKETKTKKKDVVTPVGYCWMPILENSIIRNDESNLPVALFLPENYMNTQNFGFGKHIGPDIKWADGKGSNLFKVKTKLQSTIYTQDPHTNNFFSHWQLSEGKAVSSADAETSRLLKLMHGTDVNVLIRFLPVFLNQLLKVLILVSNEDVAVNVVSLLIRVTSMLHEVNKSHLLKSYVKYTFQMEGINNKTVHEELSKHLIFYLRLGADPSMIGNILQHSWFFFDIMIKSMACGLFKDKNTLATDTHRNRFKKEFLDSLDNLFQVFIYQLVRKAKDKPTIAKEANKNLAVFVKDCFALIDRGHVFCIINYLKDQYKPADTQMLELKFEFIHWICGHEHYVALNLPIDIRIKGDVHASVLSDAFCRKHFMVGVLLKEFSEALYQPKVIRKYAIKVLRNLLVKHELDDRYTGEEKQSRIAAMYIPFLTMMLEHSLRFHKNLDRPLIDDSFLSLHLIGQVNDDRMSPMSKRTSVQSGGLSVDTHSLMSLDPSGKTPPILPFDEDESREYMLSFLYVLKNLKSVIIVDWWRDILTTPVKRQQSNPTMIYYMHHEKQFAKFMSVIDFFDLLEQCIKMFKYTGMKASKERSSNTAESTKQFLETKYLSLSKPSPRLSAVLTHKRNFSTSSMQSENVNGVDLEKRSLLEANLSNEVAVISLDMLELFCTHFKFHLEQDDGDNILMKKIFNLLMTFLRIGQSECIMNYVFASLRGFVHKFPTALFKGSTNLCGVLCYEILRLCSSKLESIRTQACCFMYLLMRSNFEYGGGGCVRVHHQVIVAVSKLIASGINRASMSQSLIMLKNYTADDKGMKTTEFPGNVRDLIKKVQTVLQATAQMKEHEDDHEVLVDLQYSLAKSYSSTPELRQTWLQSMAHIHEKNGDYSEAAMCFIHAAALVAEYLKGRGCYTGGCSSFKHISPNILPDESVANDDHNELGEMRYSLKNLLHLLEVSISGLKIAERYEVMGDVYKLAIPLYEQDRNYRDLAAAYGTLKESYDKVVEVMMSGKRVLGRYYRVAFYGRAFKVSDGKEFIYKEPKLTSLPEISFRLHEKYNSKHGNVKLIQDSSKVKPEELNPAVNYIQVTFVQPYFDEEEYEKRVTYFEKEHNIRRFVFETPFTLSGKAHGALAEQHKRKTILTTSHCFPYVKKRILVVQQEQYELSPIEVAIDEMQSKVKELNHVISLDPPDMKKLQLKLAGSVSVQVNAGPLAYAQTFLKNDIVKNYMAKHIEGLQVIYRDFVKACGQAVELNAVLIKPDQTAYHEDLKQRYADLKMEVASYLGEDTALEFPTFGSPTHSEA